MTPTLTKDDWIEIASALAVRENQLRQHMQDDEDLDKDDVRAYEDWCFHLTKIMETIGDDGQTMWPKKEKV